MRFTDGKAVTRQKQCGFKIRAALLFDIKKYCHTQMAIFKNSGDCLKLFLKGLKHGVPICLGYFSVSFGFGIMAVSLGLDILPTVIISMTNLTSAGQAAGVQIIADNGSFAEMALTELVINLRYALMSIALSQKLDESFCIKNRLGVSFGITDEIFAVASSQKGKINAVYMYGMIFISFIGWVSGTFLGAFAGNILPEKISLSLGIILYGMFIAIILPALRKSKGVAVAVAFSCILSLILNLAPVFDFISGGFAIIICAVASAAFAAAVFPVVEEEKE